MKLPPKNPGHFKTILSKLCNNNDQFIILRPEDITETRHSMLHNNEPQIRSINDFTSLKKTLGATKTGHLYKDKKRQSIYVVKYEQVRPQYHGGESRHRLTNEEIAL